MWVTINCMNIHSLHCEYHSNTQEDVVGGLIMGRLEIIILRKFPIILFLNSQFICYYSRSNLCYYSCIILVIMILGTCSRTFETIQSLMDHYLYPSNSSHYVQTTALMLTRTCRVARSKSSKASQK